MIFQSTPPVKAATYDFIPLELKRIAFQSTPPVKAATKYLADWTNSTVISIHAAREGGDYYSWRFVPDTGISIHAAREGGDIIGAVKLRRVKISIHAAREGGDKHGDL